MATAKVQILFEMKLKINNNYILAACVLVLAVLCVLSVSQPVRFQREQARREAVVKQRLLQIRQAEEAYRKRHGTYTADMGKLTRGRYLADSLQYIPFAGKKRFQLATTTLVSKTGKHIPLMECSAAYDDYLQGLDYEAIQQLNDRAIGAGNFPGLKIGDITTDNNNAGNW